MPYPYTVTIPGLRNTLRQLRSAFPTKLTADTLKKWSIAPNNETYVLNVLRFLGLIDEEGNRQSDAYRVFVEHDDEAFAKKFEALVRAAYRDLFETFGDEAWTLDRDRLIRFFRTSDETSATVGSRQASTFTTLASIAGHGPPPIEIRTAVPRAPRRRPKPGRPESAHVRARGARAAVAGEVQAETVGRPDHRGLRGPALTVRIEVNLPVTDDQGVYDKIFRSIRENLIEASVAPDA